jgi:phage baseplate assembly protein W
MIGTDATTGKPLEGLAHLRQSITDILTTPLGSRVMRRTYGSLLMQLIDQPFNGATAVRLYASVAEALMRWEPRIRVLRIGLAGPDSDQRFTLTLDAVRTDIATPNTLQQFSIPLITQQAA